MFDEATLIELVKEREFMYNPRHPDYKRSELRTITWEEIAAHFPQTTAEQCKEAWTKLRNTYTNAKKRRRDNTELPTHRLEISMQFLESFCEPKEYLQQRNIIKKNKKFKKSRKIKQEQFNNISEYEGEELESLYLQSTSNTTTLGNNTTNNTSTLVNNKSNNNTLINNNIKKNKECKNITTEIIKQLLISIKNNEQQSQKKFDHIDNFFLSLAQDVKKLNTLDQLRIRREISDIVLKAREKNILNDEDDQYYY